LHEAFNFVAKCEHVMLVPWVQKHTIFGRSPLSRTCCPKSPLGEPRGSVQYTTPPIHRDTTEYCARTWRPYVHVQVTNVGSTPPLPDFDLSFMGDRSSLHLLEIDAARIHQSGCYVARLRAPLGMTSRGVYVRTVRERIA
jgi:hypothetical protein